MFGSKFLDVVMGVDIHLQDIPTPAGPVPIPMPTPFIGMLFDPIQMAMTLLHGCPGLGLVGIALDPIGSVVNMVADKIEGVGGDPVLIHGMPATNSQSAVTTLYGVPHIVIPPAILFPDAGTPVMEGDGKFPFGSSSVWINGRRAVRTLVDPVFTCNFPVRLPTSINMPIPLGAPVIVGGAPTPDLQAIISGILRHLATSAIKNFVGPRLQMLLRKALPEGRFRDLISRAVCFATGHPVDVATGRMFTSATDWKLPGPLPLTFERHYCSVQSDRDGALGHGWNHTLDQSVWLERGRVVYRGGDGREIQAETFDFPGRVMRAGDEIFEPFSRLTFRRVKDGWEIVTVEGVTHEFRRVEGDRVEGRWRLTKSRSRDGHEISLEYDRFGTLALARDCGGRIVRFEHDRHGRLVRVELPHATKNNEWVTHTKYSYSPEGNLVAVEDALGHTTRYEYAGHLMVREIDRTGLSFYFGYDGVDSRAWCIRTWGDGGIYDRTIDYDKAGRKTYVTDSLGHVTTYRMNEALAVVEATNSQGGKTQYEYDEALRKTAEVDPLGKSTRYQYDERGNRTKCVSPDGTSATAEFNATDLPTKLVNELGGEWHWVYDIDGNLIEKINPMGERNRYEYGDGLLSAYINAEGQRTTFTYDRFKNLIWVTRPDGAKIRFDHDRRGQRVYHRDARGSEWRIKHDESGYPVRAEKPTGETEYRRYDPEGNLLEVKSSLRRIRFGYEGFHAPAWQEDGGARVTARRDSEGRLKAIINESGETYSFELDALGRVVSETAFDGTTRSYWHDPTGRVERVRHPDGGEDVLKYDAVGRLVERRYGDGTFRKFTYRSDGALLEAENETCTVSFARDGIGRILKETQGKCAVTSQYDRNGWRNLVETSLGARQVIERDPLGRVRTLRLERTTERRQYVIHLKRDEAGAEIGRELPGGITVEWQYDAAGRPASRRIKRHAPTEACENRSTTFHWAGADQLRELVDSESGSAMYTHDGRSRLVREERPGIRLHRTMDAAGHVYRSADGRDRRYDRGGRLVATDGVAYIYDPNGNLIEKRERGSGAWKYHWNGAGLLREVERPDGARVRFEYDAFARRTRKATFRAAADSNEVCEAETCFTWNGNVVAHEMSSDGTNTTWHWQPEAFAPVAMEVGGKYWSIGSDHLGTPVEMYDEAGHLAWRMRLDIFGAGSADVSHQRNPWRWPGQYADDETGLHYNRFRYYDPGSGQYIAPDPVKLAGGIRLYGYVDDPLSWSDPLGLTQTCPPEDGTQLFRSMKEGEEGQPQIGPSARQLGVRTEGPKPDIPIDAQGMVHPETGGMSVSPHDPMGLPEHRRPPSLGGTGKDPVFSMNSQSLPEGLQYRPDPRSPQTHGFIEPSGPMSIEEYQRLLGSTASSWTK